MLEALAGVLLVCKHRTHPPTAISHPTAIPPNCDPPSDCHPNPVIHAAPYSSDSRSTQTRTHSSTHSSAQASRGRKEKHATRTPDPTPDARVHAAGAALPYPSVAGMILFRGKAPGRVMKGAGAPQEAPRSAEVTAAHTGGGGLHWAVPSTYLAVACAKISMTSCLLLLLRVWAPRP